MATRMCGTRLHNISFSLGAVLVCVSISSEVNTWTDVVDVMLDALRNAVSVGRPQHPNISSTSYINSLFSGHTLQAAMLVMLVYVVLAVKESLDL